MLWEAQHFNISNSVSKTEPLHAFIKFKLSESSCQFHTIKQDIRNNCAKN